MAKKLYEIHPADVIWVAPNERHWRGATLITTMTHIAIQYKRMKKWLIGSSTFLWSNIGEIDFPNSSRRKKQKSKGSYETLCRVALVAIPILSAGDDAGPGRFTFTSEMIVRKIFRFSSAVRGQNGVRCTFPVQRTPTTSKIVLQRELKEACIGRIGPQ